ncbi:Lrp/AsnC family transcriptional regulator [Thermococcus radiotolerans]|jgi:DNA-binding Lrp family transcriptional regulator|uniref:Transcriptional regulator n=1 Tax=Thermococcus radiotolerans TaxID=187880 RepID=A0A2Z2NB35_9EURY|nr:Lrp/AsnC family transcriptional regulator [Thermococcus radiotolerans]ASJ15019.1 transcriptional regulator [Thermococcus radiotolerans]
MVNKKKKSYSWDPEDIKFWREMSKGELSDLDVKIFLALRENGRLPDTELARITGVSVPTARRHRISLQERGYIRIMALFIFEEFGLASADVIVKFKEDAPKEKVASFMEEAISHRKVFEIDEYIGEYNVVIKFFDKDFKELKKTIDEFLQGRDIIQKTLILPAVSSPKLFTTRMKYKHV